MKPIKLTPTIIESEITSMDSFLTIIGKFPLFSIEEEKELAQRIQSGDKEALNRLMQSNQRFAVSVAMYYRREGYELMELIEVANEGMLEAAKRFDGKKGFKFISYAVWWMRMFILEYIDD